MAPLTSTNELIKEYGKALIDGTINDEELSALMNDERFSRSSTYDAFSPVTDSNHSVLDSLRDFVATIGPQIPLATFHQLTIQLIAPAVKALEGVTQARRDTLMRDSTLDRIFLSYEFAHAKDAAETHFQKGGILYQFQLPKNEESLKNVLLKENIRFFKTVRDQAKAAEKEEREAIWGEIITTATNAPEIDIQLRTQVINLASKLLDKPSQALIQQFQELTVLVKETEAALSEELTPSKTKGFLSSLMEGFTQLCCRLLSPFMSIIGKKETISKEVLSDIMEKYVPKLEGGRDGTPADSAHI
ncbi:MAG: hypothetical protein P1U32_02010 [Legionellaceae bacterium]|nr:hypothetical protein [Legionellaceae bacterium]